MDDACWMTEWALKAAKKLAKNGRFVDMLEVGFPTLVRQGWVVGESFSKPRGTLALDLHGIGRSLGSRR